MRLSESQPHRIANLTSPLDTTKLREALTKAEKEYADRKKEHDNAQQDIDELFDPKFFGSQGEWRQPSNQCLSKNTGEYVPVSVTCGMYAHRTVL